MYNDPVNNAAVLPAPIEYNHDVVRQARLDMESEVQKVVEEKLASDNLSSTVRKALQSLIVKPE